MTGRGSAKLGEFFPNSRRHPIEHGTTAGHRAHYRYGVPMCDPCREANRVARDYREARVAGDSRPPLRPMPVAVTYAMEPWREHAACLGHKLPPVTWDDYPGFGQREDDATRTKRTAAAKAVCWNECKVREACLAAVNLKLDEGVRGGKDLRDLKAARKRGAA